YIFPRTISYYLANTVTGMIVGLILRLTANHTVLKNASFNDQVFFNLLLPPIILGAGYELHQVSRADLILFLKTNVIADKLFPKYWPNLNICFRWYIHI